MTVSTETLPLLPLTSGVLLPGMVVTMALESDEARAAVETAVLGVLRAGAPVPPEDNGGAGFDQATTYAFGFSTVSAPGDGSAINVNLDATEQADYQAMVKAGYSVYYSGTATWAGSQSGPRSGTFETISPAIAAAARMEPTERSMPPVRMTKVMPAANTVLTAACCSTIPRFWPLKKRPSDRK